MSSTTISTLPVMLLGAMAPLMRRDFDVPLGTFVASMYAAAAASSLAVGMLINRHGAKYGIAVGAVLSGMSLGIGVVATETEHLLPLALLSGLGLAAAQIGSNHLLAGVIPASRQGLAYGIKQASLPVAGLVAGLSLPLIAIDFGWRAAFLTGTVIALAFCVPSFRLHIEQRRQPLAGTWSRAMLPVLPLAVGAGLGGAAVTTMAPFLVDWAVSVDIPLESAGLLLALGGVMGASVRVWAGWVVDQRSMSAVGAAACLLLTGSVGLALMAIAQLPVLRLAGVVIAFAGVWGWGGLALLALARDSVASKRPAALSMAMHQVGTMTGGVLGPLLFGVIVEEHTFSIAWLFLAVVTLVGAIVMVTSRISSRPATLPGSG